MNLRAILSAMTLLSALHADDITRFSWQTFDNPSLWRPRPEWGAGAPKFSLERSLNLDGKAVVRLEYATTTKDWYCIAINLALPEAADLSTWGGFTMDIFNPTDHALPIAIGLVDEDGAKLTVRHQALKPWVNYSKSPEAFIPAGPGWQTVVYALDILHGEDGIALMTNRAPLSRVRQWNLILKDEGGKAEKEAQKGFVLLGRIRALTPEQTPRAAGMSPLQTYPDSISADLPGGKEAFAALASAKAKAAARDWKGALAACATALDVSPRFKEVRALVKKIYLESLSASERNALKAAYRARYQDFMRADLGKARGYASLHEELVNLWSENPPLFSFGPGTQTIGTHYGFTDKPRLIETAEAIRAMGSDSIKFTLGKKTAPSNATYVDLAREADVQHLFAMDFRNYILWVLPAGGKMDFNRNEATNESAWADEYRNMFELAAYVLKTYDGSGKTFLFGNWEGDWVLCGSGKPDNDPTPHRLRAMATWWTVRQKAVDAAKASQAHANVRVWHYIEGNSTRRAMAGAPRVVNAVVPFAQCDFYSFSSYDMTSKGELSGIHDRFPAGLDFMQAQLPPRDIPGRRVFIGEYGFAQNGNGFDDATLDHSTRLVMRESLRWGCPLILYWQIYDNEWQEEQKRYNGFWIIDNTGRKTSLYKTHVDYYAKCRPWVDAFQKTNLRLPTMAELAPRGLEWLE